jgi:hypothetical protein
MPTWVFVWLLLLALPDCAPPALVLSVTVTPPEPELCEFILSTSILLLLLQLRLLELLEEQLFCDCGPVFVMEQLGSAAATPTVMPVLTTRADTIWNNFFTSHLPSLGY